jgi:hypothetical protein
MMTDPLEQVRLLKKRLEQEVGKMGFELLLFSIAPEGEDDAVLEVSLSISPESLSTPEEREQLKIDADFEALMLGSIDDSDDEKQNELNNLMDEWEL